MDQPQQPRSRTRRAKQKMRDRTTSHTVVATAEKGVGCCVRISLDGFDRERGFPAAQALIGIENIFRASSFDFNITVADPPVITEIVDVFPPIHILRLHVLDWSV